MNCRTKINANISNMSIVVISCIPFLVFFCGVNGVNGETPARVYAYMRVYMRAYVRKCTLFLYISLSYRITVITVINVCFCAYLCVFSVITVTLFHCYHRYHCYQVTVITVIMALQDRYRSLVVHRLSEIRRLLRILYCLFSPIRFLS